MAVSSAQTSCHVTMIVFASHYTADRAQWQDLFHASSGQTAGGYTASSRVIQDSL